MTWPKLRTQEKPASTRTAGPFNRVVDEKFTCNKMGIRGMTKSKGSTSDDMSRTAGSDTRVTPRVDEGTTTNAQ